MSKFKQTRRTFIKTAGLGTAAFLIPGCGNGGKDEGGKSGEAATEKQVPRAGLQLWTIRKAIEEDMPGALRRVAEMGYVGVETARLPEHIAAGQRSRRAASGPAAEGRGRQCRRCRCPRSDELQPNVVFFVSWCLRGSVGWVDLRSSA